jgi:hypothetical protein
MTNAGFMFDFLTIIHERVCRCNRQIELVNITNWHPQFLALAIHSGIDVIKTPFRTPKANAFCERFMGSLKRECLDHSLVLHQMHLKRLVNEYCGYFNEERPHQGIQQHIPNRSDSLSNNRTGEVKSLAFLGGLHHSYSWVSNPLQANLPSG